MVRSAGGCDQRLVMARSPPTLSPTRSPRCPNKLLEMQSLKGHHDRDAFNCSAIAQQIIDQGGDYVLALNGKQGCTRRDTARRSRERPMLARVNCVSRWTGRYNCAQFGQANLRSASSEGSWSRRNMEMFRSELSGLIYFYLGKFIDARIYYENARSLWDPRYRALGATPNDPYVASLVYLSRTLLCLGYVDQARLRRDEARRLSPYTLVFALRHAWSGDWAIEGVKAGQTMLHSAEDVLTISRAGVPVHLRSWDH
jgi:hypothetical protein